MTEYRHCVEGIIMRIDETTGLPKERVTPVVYVRKSGEEPYWEYYNGKPIADGWSVMCWREFPIVPYEAI